MPRKVLGLLYENKTTVSVLRSLLVFKTMVTAPLRGRAFKHIFLIDLVWWMRETGQICAFRSSKAVKRVREVLEAARIFLGFFVLPCV